MESTSDIEYNVLRNGSMHNIQSMHNIRNSKLFEIFELNELNLISGDLNKRGEGVRRTSRVVVYLSNSIFCIG